MIIEAQQLDIGTRVCTPQLGERVVRTTRFVRRLDGTHDVLEQRVLAVIAYWPLLGIWEIAVESARPPQQINISVQLIPGSGQVWREVSGR